MIPTVTDAGPIQFHPDGVSWPEMRSSSAFTLIELLVVLAIITILGLMAVPGTARAISRGAVNQAADDLLRVAHQAQSLAKRATANGPLASAPHWGVAVIGHADGSASATVLYGTTTAHEWEVDGLPGFRLDLPSHMQVQADTGSGLAVLTGRIGWFYQYGTGWPITGPATQVPVSIGTEAQAEVDQDSMGSVGSSGLWRAFTQYIEPIDASPVCSELVLSARNGRYRVALAIYDTGMASQQEVR